MKIKCLKCGDIIENDLKGTMVWCKCGSCFLDGTPYYVRVGGQPENIHEITKEEEKKMKKREYDRKRRQDPEILKKIHKCSSEYQKKRYHNDEEYRAKRLEYVKQYVEKNREKIRQYQRERYLKMKEGK